MAVLEWGIAGQRFFETGIDRGVLYPKTGAGVAWVGLTSVSEAPNGGDAKPYYIDGYKYLNISTAEDFAATIEAFSAPAEFDRCDGTAALANGLFVTQQPRENFGFSYRTRVGNDQEGSDYGYKLHLVYNALAAPSQRNNASISDSMAPISLSWAITTAPPLITGHRPTAHYIIDSRYTVNYVMDAVEDTIYGTASTEAYLPTIAELIEIFAMAPPSP